MIIQKVKLLGQRQVRRLFLLSLMLFSVGTIWNRAPLLFRKDSKCSFPPITEDSLSLEPTTIEETYYTSPLCQCDKEVDIIDRESLSPNSTTIKWCSDEASLRGMHQKVISFSLYVATHNHTILQRYSDLLNDIALSMSKGYTDWVMRIYHNLTNAEGESKNTYINMCDVFCRFSHVDLCYVPQIVERLPPSSITDSQLISGMNPVLFRYLVMLDPAVDVFVARDTDNPIWNREVHAVQQWLNSSYTFHVMRDHISQKHLLPSGLWGAKSYQKRGVISSLVHNILSMGQIKQSGFHNQKLLDEVAWPLINTDVVGIFVFHMAHDSYNCDDSNITKQSPIRIFPFPTKRKGNIFVGQSIQEEDNDPNQLAAVEKCPSNCRPTDHKDWTYC